MRWNSEKCCVEYHLTYLNGNECGWRVSEYLNKYKNENVTTGIKIESTELMQMEKTCGIIFNEANYADEVELNLGDYEIEVRNGRTYAVRKKPKYPTTYEECRKIIDYHLTGTTIIGYKKSLLENFQQLLICRDAYWKIAGEEMGLGKPWEPDWKNETQVKYMITTFNNKFEFFSSMHSYVVGRRNHILSFPTEEILDAFYDNFKDLIESCKELL